MSPGEDWPAQRHEAIAGHQARLQARREAEHLRAEEMLSRFVDAATNRGPTPVPLRVKGYAQGRSARTDLHGWYLRSDHRAAVDTTGQFYLLTQPLSFLDTFRRMTPPGTRPPLVLGAGGRDGEAITLQRALDRILPGWDHEHP